MRVLVIVPDAYSYGGTSRFLERLLELHDRQRIETGVLVPDGARDEYVALLSTRFTVEIIAARNRNRPDTSPFMTPFFDFIFSWRTARSWRPDLIVVSTANPGRMSVALYYPFPVLYVLHSMPEHRFRFLPRCYLRLGLMFNNLVMTVSNAAAETISIVMGIPQDSISVVHNSCNSIKQTLDSNIPVVLTVGHVVAYKNPDGWLAVAREVIQALPDITFVWVGDGELLDIMRAQIIKLGLGDRIIFAGFVSDSSTWYETAQVYFQPSLLESHGIAVLEAMSHRLPCVVADTGGLPESVVDGETGYVCPSADSAGFAERITQLLNNPVLRERMGNAGRQRVEGCFSEEVQERKLMVIYDQLTKNEKI